MVLNFGMQPVQKTKPLSEASLKNLDQLALEIDSEFGNKAIPAKAEQVRAFTGAIRQKFPKVLFGEKERTWNKIKDITVRQSGPQSAEVSWKSEQLSSSTLFMTNSLPLFDQMIPVSKDPQDEHKVLWRVCRLERSIT